MRDAFGGIFSLSLLMVFILIVSGFISLAINYTRSYRVKNYVLTMLEKYEGNTENKDMLERTYNYAKSMGYVAPRTSYARAESKSYTCPKYNGENIGWCYKDGVVEDDTFTMDIVVFVNLNIPIIKQAFANFEFFWLPGTTNLIPKL